MFFYTDLIHTKQLLTDQFFSDILGAELRDSINNQIQRFTKEKQTMALFSSRPLFFYLHWRLLGPSSCWIHAVGGKKEEERTVHKKPDCFHRSACYCHTTTTPVSHLPQPPKGHSMLAVKDSKVLGSRSRENWSNAVAACRSSSCAPLMSIADETGVA